MKKGNNSTHLAGVLDVHRNPCSTSSPRNCHNSCICLLRSCRATSQAMLDLTKRFVKVSWSEEGGKITTRSTCTSHFALSLLSVFTPCIMLYSDLGAYPLRNRVCGNLARHRPGKGGSMRTKVCGPVRRVDRASGFRTFAMTSCSGGCRIKHARHL